MINVKPMIQQHIDDGRLGHFDGIEQHGSTDVVDLIGICAIGQKPEAA